VVTGSPDEVVEQLTELATDLNVGHLMLLMQFASMGKDLAAYNTKLFADRVLTHYCNPRPRRQCKRRNSHPADLCALLPNAVHNYIEYGQSPKCENA
jgi:hypothetical protein